MIDNIKKFHVLQPAELLSNRCVGSAARCIAGWMTRVPCLSSSPPGTTGQYIIHIRSIWRSASAWGCSGFSLSLSLYIYIGLVKNVMWYKSQWNLPYLWSLRCLPGLWVVHAWGCSCLPVRGISPSPSGILNRQSPARHNQFLYFDMHGLKHIVFILVR